MHSNLFIVCFLFICFCVVSNNSTAITPIKNCCERIVKEQIADERFLHVVKNYIDSLDKSDSIFAKGIGYITIYLQGETMYQGEYASQSFRLNHNYSSFDNVKSTSRYPDYFLKYSHKIILIYSTQNENLIEFNNSRKSVQNFKKELEPFLFPKVKIKLPDKSGKLGTAKNFRPNEVERIHGGKQVYLPGDKSTKPIVQDLKH